MSKVKGRTLLKKRNIYKSDNLRYLGSFWHLKDHYLQGEKHELCDY